MNPSLTSSLFSSDLHLLGPAAQAAAVAAAPHEERLDPCGCGGAARVRWARGVELLPPAGLLLVLGNAPGDPDRYAVPGPSGGARIYSQGGRPSGIILRGGRLGLFHCDNFII